MEKDMIEKLQPEFNQAMNGKIYNCPYCKPQKTYKNRGSFESHMAEKHGYWNNINIYFLCVINNGVLYMLLRYEFKR